MTIDLKALFIYLMGKGQFPIHGNTVSLANTLQSVTLKMIRRLLWAEQDQRYVAALPVRLPARALALPRAVVGSFAPKAKRNLSFDFTLSLASSLA